MNERYLLSCECGQTTPVTIAQAGRELGCVCGKVLHVPTMRGIRQLPPAPQAAGTRRPATWSPVQGGMFAGGLVIATVSLLMIGYCLFHYAAIGGLTIDRTADVTSAMTKDIDKLSPVAALDVWQH